MHGRFFFHYVLFKEGVWLDVKQQKMQKEIKYVSHIFLTVTGKKKWGYLKVIGVGGIQLCARRLTLLAGFTGDITTQWESKSKGLLCS